MLKRDKEEIVFNERNILINVNHPFIIKLHYAFQTVHFTHLFSRIKLNFREKNYFSPWIFVLVEICFSILKRKKDSQKQKLKFILSRSF